MFRKYTLFAFIFIFFCPFFNNTSVCEEKKVESYFSPLTKAIESGQNNIAKELILNGANVNGDPDRFSVDIPLVWATFFGRTEIVELLLNKGANPNRTMFGESAVHVASGGALGDMDCPNHVSEQTRLNILKLLVSSNADIHLRDSSDFTPLHSAAYTCSPKIADFLIEHGANVNAKMKGDADYDHSGYTPLHWASDRGCLNCIQLLIDHGAEINAKIVHDFYLGKTPLDLCHDSSCKELLRRNGGKSISELN